MKPQTEVTEPAKLPLPVTGLRKQKRASQAKRLGLLEQSLEELKRDSEQFQEQQNQKLRALAETLTTIYNNQVELSNSGTKVDTQHAVLGRLAISTLNELLLRIGSEDLITYESVSEMFEQFAALRSRPDWREHSKDWYMGKDLSNLPPVPEAESPEATKPEASEFGGDYAETTDIDEASDKGAAEGEGPAQEDALPPGQETDGPSSSGAAVPSV